MRCLLDIPSVRGNIAKESVIQILIYGLSWLRLLCWYSASLPHSSTSVVWERRSKSYTFNHKKAPSLHAVETRDFFYSFLNGLLGYPFLECYWLLPNKRKAIRKFSGTTLKNDSSAFHLYSSIFFWLIVTFFSVSMPVVVCQMGTRDPLLK